MIESLMLFALGFLIATLFAIIASQFIWRRAVTVTTRNLVGTDPVGEEHDALRELLDDRNARLAELSTRLEKLEANEPPFHGASQEKDQQRQSEAEAATIREMERLRARLSELEAELARSQAVRQAQDDDLAAMNRRIADFEAALANDTHRKEQSQAALRSIGERAARLAYDLNNIVEEVAPRKKAQEEPQKAHVEAPDKAPEKSAGDKTQEKARETPGDGKPDEPHDNGVADTLEELTDRVEAAYGTPSEAPSPASSEEAMDDEGEKPDGGPLVPERSAGKPGASPLDERIRALEAGLPH